MTIKKTGLDADLKVRFTKAEKDQLRRVALRRGVDMSVLCRSVIVDYLTSSPEQREQIIAIERSLVDIMEHVIRTRSLVNADLLARYPDGPARRDVVAVADELQMTWTGEIHDAE